ncbi:Putative dynamin stalk domain, GTPase effector domain-containing protein [Colletotrichum destructivum]|uniref:Dynamin stalk domain, GTPase effector domain-containing protein n=1 Tax=Colletotrichum destructivum TaxID=34406 RepID=A0AAX4IK98_9PEZI|nr:Putative dynamin stalk domain, GTPase effector domain-containing protein [Colletotrichum destructivum]
MAPAHSKTQAPGLGNRNLLDKIDKLRELGISKQVALPQLVVVGDQSSGKSSVESLTGYYFPRSVGLCTRHATEIVCRRENTSSIVVNIQPFDATFERAERAKAFRREIQSLKGEEFANALKEAADVMGLKISTDDTSEGDAFSKDVLRVEICGPDEEHLTIIDVPGIFENAQDGVSTARDVALVKSMIKDYIKESRTIILAVIPCNVDVATQTILTYAAEADPEGKRTLGVLTKPDLVSENATREAAMDLIRGKRRDIQLGYYVVKNRGADDTSSSKEERDFQEKLFFGEDPWSKLDKLRLGIPALRNRLRELLMDRTESEFPKVRREINERFAEARSKLETLGQPRSTADEQRAYLGKIVSRYTQLRDFSLNAYYTGVPLFENNPKYRLAALIREMNSAFSAMFFKSAHTRTFDELDNDEKVKTRSDEVASEPESENESFGRDDLYNVTFTMPEDEFGELDVVLSEPCMCAAPQTSGIMEHLKQLYLASRGFEMGTVGLSPYSDAWLVIYKLTDFQFNNHMLPTAFKEQSKKWESITLAHVSNVILVVHHFIFGVVKEASGDHQVLDALWSSIVEDLVKRYQMAMQQAKLLVHVEREGHYDGLDYVKYSDLEREPTDVEGVSETCNIIHDVLHSYYDIASARFSDMICTQVIDYFLIDAENSPLNVLSSNLIYKMTAEQLDMVAGEDAVTKVTREMLKSDIKLFEQGRKVLRT